MWKFSEGDSSIQNVDISSRYWIVTYVLFIKIIIYALRRNKNVEPFCRVNDSSLSLITNLDYTERRFHRISMGGAMRRTRNPEVTPASSDNASWRI